MLKHNEITYNQVKTYIENGQDCCVVNPCGSGKSIILKNIIEDNQDKRILVVTKQANAFNYYKSMSPVFKDVTILTYNKLLNLYRDEKLKELHGVDICVFDEAHYIGAHEWSKAVHALRDKFNCISVGLTATPQRYEDQGTTNSIISEFDGNIAGNYTVTQLQREGVFIEPEYIVSLSSVEEDAEILYEQIADSDLSDTKKEVYNTRLADYVEEWKNNYSPEIVIKENLPKYLYKVSGNKILVFCNNVADTAKDEKFIMNLLRKQFPNKRLKSYIYTHKSSESVLSEFLSNKSNYINVLFSVNKVCETLHIPDLSVMFFMRVSFSNRVITQQIGRLNNLNSENKGLIIDMVNNISRYKQVNKTFGAVGSRVCFSKQYGCYKPNTHYVGKAISIFETIDKVTRTNIYIYKSFRGTLAQVCFVARRDIRDVKRYMADGYSLEDAISNSRRIKPNSLLDVYGRDSLDYDFNFKLTDEENKLVTEYLPLISYIAEAKMCKDAEIIDSCGLYLCYLVHNYNSTEQALGLSSYLRNSLSNYILRQIRLNFDKDIYVEDFDASDTVYTLDLSVTDIKAGMKKIIKDLDDRQKFILVCRYGLQDLNIDLGDFADYKIPNKTGMTLDEIASLTHCTRERIRQIEAKALRLLRHPRRAKYIRDFY